MESEFAFELRTCQWIEYGWERFTTGDTSGPILVARQLGTKYRRWDTVVIECDRKELDRRGRFGEKRLDGDLLDVVPHAPVDWAYYRDALPNPGYPWRYVREAIHRADDRGILHTRKRNNRIEIKRRWRYPDWVDRIIAIENKPDLSASAARSLRDQLEYDVSLALADEVWVATKPTDRRIEPMLLEELPVEVGILVVEDEPVDSSLIWNPRTLAVGDNGIRIIERPNSQSKRAENACRFEIVDPSEKESIRYAIAERAYERGWRAYIENMRPDCRHFELHGTIETLPRCVAKGRSQSESECSHACESFEPEPPHWRRRGWPIRGGPGRGVRSFLDRRRRDRRPSA